MSKHLGRTRSLRDHGRYLTRLLFIIVSLTQLRLTGLDASRTKGTRKRTRRRMNISYIEIYVSKCDLYVLIVQISERNLILSASDETFHKSRR